MVTLKNSIFNCLIALYNCLDGWLHGRSYRFNIKHHPDDGLINMKLWEGSTLVADTGDIIDNGEGSLRGGRMGVFCYSQQSITWSALSYR